MTDFNKSRTIPQIAVIGAGKMTMKRHLPSLFELQKEGHCQIVSVCDINKELADGASKKFSVPKVFYDARQAIEDKDVDTVCIFGPAIVHYEFGMFALMKGKHLFVEKPPAPSSSQLQEMINISNDKKLVAAVGFNRRFQKNINYIKSKLKPEDINFVEASFYKPFANQPVQFGMSSWIWINGIHAIDTVCYLIGDVPVRIKLLKKDLKSKKADSALILLEWKNGSQASVTLNNSSGIRLEKYVVHGFGQTYISEGQNLTVTSDNDYSETHNNPSDSNGGIKEEFVNFFKSIGGEENLKHSLSSALPTIKLVELIEKGFEGNIDDDFTAEIGVKEEIEGTSQLFLEKQSNLENRPTLLILNTKAMSSALAEASKYFNVVFDFPLDIEQQKRVVAITAGGSQSSVPVETHFNELKNIKALGVLGASVKRWGGEIAFSKKIDVMNTADTYAVPVAEFILMQALIGLRKAVSYDSVLKSGGWSLQNDTKSSIQQKIKRIVIAYLPLLLKKYLKLFFNKNRPQSHAVVKYSRPTKTLNGRSVCFLGYGEITKRAIPLFKACGAQVQVMSEYLSKESASELGVEKVGISLAVKADVVIMNRGVSERTIRSFGRNEVMSMRSGSVFINAARAELVDTEALIERVEKGDIYACIDVFDKEPLPKDNKFRRLKNVFLTPHIAGSLNHVEGLEEIAAKDLIDKLVAYFYEGDVKVAISREQLKNMT